MYFNGPYLLKARQAKRLTQEQLGVAAGLTGMTIHRLESGKQLHPKLQTVSCLAAELGVKPEDLLTSNGRKRSK